MADDEVNNSKHGKLLSVKRVHVFKIPLADFMDIQSNSEDCLEILEKEEFAQMLKNRDLSHILEHNIVHINFVPAAFETEEDIEFITRKRQIVKVDSKASASSLSILTLPFPVPGGVRAAVDVFGDDPDLMETQLMAQIRNLKSRIGQRNTTDLFLTVTVPQSLTDHYDRLADQKGLEKYRLPRGKLNRRVIKMFVYEKSMNE